MTSPKWAAVYDARAARRPSLDVLRPPNLVETQYLLIARLVDDVFRQVVTSEVAAPEARTDALLDPLLRSLVVARVRLNEALSPRGLVPRLLGVADTAVRFARTEVGRVLGKPDLGAQLEVERQSFIRQNVDLIRRMSAEQLDEIERILRAGGTADDLEHALGITARRAKMIATDQTLKLNAQLTRALLERNGVDGYEWITMEDYLVRPWHQQLHGRRFTYANPPQVSKTGRRANPGEDYHCRCLARPVIS